MRPKRLGEFLETRGDPEARKRESEAKVGRTMDMLREGMPVYLIAQDQGTGKHHVYEAVRRLEKLGYEGLPDGQHIFDVFTIRDLALRGEVRGAS